MYENMIKHYIKMANPDSPIEYIRNISKDYIRNKIDQQILNCNKCNICNNNYKTITYGNTNSELIIIGNNPHKKEKNYPFELEPVKDKLNTIFDFYNINKEYVFYMNVINCWPNTDNLDRAPSLEEINNCSQYTKNIIETIKPKAIILLGPAPYNALRDSEFYNSFNNIKGQWVSILGIPAMVTHNIYDFEDKNKWTSIDDLTFAKEEFVDHFVEVFEKIKQDYPNNYLLSKGD